MKVLFLDVDGVLNSHRTILTTGNCAHPHNYELRPHMFDRYAITMLQGLCRAGDVKVVLSSSWRLGMQAEHLEAFAKFLGLPIIDKTAEAWQPHQRRGHEIKAWLDAHPEVESYAIVDDDCDMLPEQRERFVQTFYEDGLTFAPFSKLCDLFGVNVWDCAVPRESSTALGVGAPADPLTSLVRKSEELDLYGDDFDPHKAALRRIASMDPEGKRADDLGRAARIARDALGVEGLACTSCDCSTPVGKAADCKWGWECQAWRDARRDPNYASGVRRDDDGYLTAVYELLQIPELCRTPDLLMERVLDLQRKAAVAGYRAALESSGRDVSQRAIAAPPPIAGVEGERRG